MLSLDGAALQGTLGNEAGSGPLTNVMLDGNKITFTAARQTQRGSFELTYTGEVAADGDTMTGRVKSGEVVELGSRSPGPPRETITDRMGEVQPVK